ncbi:DNA/RNA non-specific endonuclease [Paenibacillus bovis]|uniref:Endonuclease n=1 Tax=Paenibacillus bovis TaxID=1616788 RepID=A0A172ZJC9_9BACL|nr:DNA/RNA non-specific endonuclease [Paenibacillus bovis]ANF97502.1 endonuclease [Paenibacillus bovis]
MAPQDERYADEKIRVGEAMGMDWYEQADGYDSKFLGEQYEIPHPGLSAELIKDIAPLHNSSIILDYTHFSIVMSRSRRLAIYTVVNIDGSQLQDAGRSDKWRYDSRMDEQYQSGDEIYRDNDLDRGHLVRRRDPIWGKDADRANVDTFHFTNCAPQHKDLNQDTWLGLEDYILEHARSNKRKATIFTGPVFRDSDIAYRGIQLPEEYWKVAAIVKDNGQLSVTAYLISQKGLLRTMQTEDELGPYKTYQVKVAHIEELTGLDFRHLREHDAYPAEAVATSMTIESVQDIHI